MIQRSKQILSNLFHKNKMELIIAAALILLFSLYQIKVTSNLSQDGIYTKAKIIDCKRKYYAGRWHVKIEYNDENGKVITRTATLYKFTECLIGMEIEIRYSSTSDAFEIIE